MQDKIALPTIWEIPDDMWTIIQPLLPARRPAGTPGQPQLCFRRVLNGILYVMRTGCQWKAVPRVYGSGSSVHRYFQQWVTLGVFDRCWAIVLERYDDLVGIGWEWLSADGTMLKAPLGGEKCGPNPTDRAKSGTKRHLLVDQQGAPLALELAGANCPDMRLLEPTLDAIVTDRPTPTLEAQQHICLDKGYDYADCDRTITAHEFVGHTRRKGESVVEKAKRTHPARRWVVERTHSWYNRFRKLMTRYEKKACNYLGLVDFASALLVYRIIYRLSPNAASNRVLG
ncbi:MAG: IS5 family transposase [Alphaproteobacteria bacterium]|nr:IS5 family transposase [Alphaproteobacteria bacterium]